MAAFKILASRIRIEADAAIGPKKLSAYLAAKAISERDKLINSGEAPAHYDTYVDGKKNGVETQVRPNGIITYKFNWLGTVLETALDYVQKRSPVLTGRFKKSWVVIVNGRLWLNRLDLIPRDAEVMLLNPLPYSRKIEVRAIRRLSGSKMILAQARGVLRRRFPNLEIERSFVDIPPGQIRGAPYILKKKRAVKNRKTKQISYTEQVLTYPALIFRHRL